MNTPAGEIIVEHPEPGFAVVRINRPEVHNALNMPVRAEMARQVALLDSDPEIRVIVITGGDKVFAAGADLVELRARKLHDKAFR